MTDEDAKLLAQRNLTAARCLAEQVKPNNSMEAIILKATCELLVENATALLKRK